MSPMESHYQYGTVTLSFLVAIFASFVSLDLVGSVSQASGRIKAFWLGGGALAMGIGIWSMHFIGMLAFQMHDMTMAYDVALMMLSILVAVAASGFALSIMSRPSVSKIAITGSAIAMAIAIAGMHYIGMYSMRMPAQIVWNPWLVGLSLLIALMASFAAIIVALKLPSAPHPFQTQIGASILMGIAIAGMHYTGMEAADFYDAEVAIDSGRTVIASSQLVTAVAFSTILILAIALTGSIVDRALTRRRLREEENIRKAREAEAASALKTRFLANMSHEIRTPLGAIRGFTELLLEGSATEAQQQDYLKTILRSAHSLSQLLDDILDLSKIEMDKLEIEKSAVSYRTLLQDTFSLLKIKADEKGLTLRQTDDSSLPEKILTDSARLRQILINLLSNAIKFTSHGGVHLRIHRIEGGDYAKIGFEIEDTGIGLTDLQQARLFEPFSQGDNSMSRRFGGSGLGLDISRRLARALGGDVEIVRSAAGVGTTFLVTIALEIPKFDERLAAVPTPAVETTALARLDGLKVLVVDDNADNQLLIGRILEKRGAQVSFADNGASGIAAATATDFDVILMDIQMPIMNGYEATRTLRAQGLRTPIVALTAHALREDREMCLAAGCNDYLIKPIHVAELVSTLRRYFASQVQPA